MKVVKREHEATREPVWHGSCFIRAASVRLEVFTEDLAAAAIAAMTLP